MKTLTAIILFVAASALADWRFDWTVRTDPTGKPAGILTNTPFPLTEASTSYTITNDEGAKTFQLGTLYFVDGAAANDAGDGLSLGAAKKSIGAAINAAGSGNKTILVRGAHDAFSGVYSETVSFYGHAGVSDTSRLMLVGYGQERPVIDGTNGQDSIIGRGDASNAYITVQRLKLQNTQASGVRLGWDVDLDKRDQYFNCVDVWFYACGNLAAETNGFLTSGNCYYLNTDHGYISHCLFERSVGHGVKIGDGSSHCILEWSVSRENGWWSGRTSFTNSRTVAIDLPADRDTATNDVVRYCIASGCVSHGLELRRVHNFRVYCNEVTDFGHGLEMTGDMNGAVPYGVLVMATSWGNVERNLIHSACASNTNGTLLIVQSGSTNGTVLVDNNLIYDAPASASAIYLDYQNAAKVLIYNNTLVQSNGSCVIGIRAEQAWTNEVVNNIVWQRGAGLVGDLIYNSVAPVHHHNLYYYPQGAGPDWGTSGEQVADPKCVSSSSWLLAADSPAIGAGTNLSAFFSTDLQGVIRPIGAWSLGAHEANPARTGRRLLIKHQ